MKAVIQRVLGAKVTADGEVSGSCGRGLYLLLGVYAGDGERDADLLVAKISKLRIFEDAGGKMNLSVLDVDGEALVVSNFTLCANYAHGNRPDYLSAEKPERAEKLYEYFIAGLKKVVRHVGHGKFGADMQTEMVTDGPVTIVMDSEVLGGTKHDFKN